MINPTENLAVNETHQMFNEAFGNFRNIFNQKQMPFPEFIENLEKTKKVLSVNPLEYFKDVGNGMNVESQQAEVVKIIPPEITVPKVRAELAIKFIESGNHIGVSQLQFERDLAAGKNHDETMKFFLKQVLARESLGVCVVVKTKQAESKFGKGINKVVLDGTHRAVIASVVNLNLEIIEFSAD